MEGRLGSLLDADARLCTALDTARSGSIHWRRCPRTSRAFEIIVIHIVRVNRSSGLLLLRHRSSNHYLLLLRRHRRGVGCSVIIISQGTQRTQRILHSFKAGRLSDEAPWPARGPRCRNCSLRTCGLGAGRPGLGNLLRAVA